MGRLGRPGRPTAYSDIPSFPCQIASTNYKEMMNSHKTSEAVPLQPKMLKLQVERIFSNMIICMQKSK